MPKSYLDVPKMTLGFRNNNPGNLRVTSAAWVGKLWDNRGKGFERFINMRYGLRALLINLSTGHKRGVNTVQSIITKYAPASDGNNTAKYITDVAKALGVNPNAKLSLTKSVHIGLAKAIVKVETGKDAALLTDADYLDAYDAISHKTAVKSAVSAAATAAAAFALFFYSFFCLTV